MDFEQLLDDALEETGRDLGDLREEVMIYAAQRAAHLATISHEPGFNLAVRAERNNVAMKAGLDLTDAADASDARLVGIIQAGLLFLAGARPAGGEETA